MIFLIFGSFTFLFNPLCASIFLKDNLKQANPGDFIVTAQNKCYTILNIKGKMDQYLAIEEITVPGSRLATTSTNWREWVQSGAPGHTAWVLYLVDLQTGQMMRYFTLSQMGWMEMQVSNPFLTTLLNLKLQEIPSYQRKRIGISVFGLDRRPFWQPRMVVDGQTISGVSFTAWKTHWPNDGSELAGKLIEVYVPESYERYPSYFPYWLQISGGIAKAKIRIVDSGTALRSMSPKLPFFSSKH